MKVMSNLRALVFPHKGWPYPRGEREIRQAIIVTGIVLAIVLGGLIFALKANEQRVLSREDVQLDAKSLVSYGNQMLLLSTKSQNSTLVKPYREVYMQQLSTNIEGIHTDLSNHLVATMVGPQAHQLAEIADDLDTMLASFARDPTDGTLQGNLSDLKSTVKHMQDIEESL